MRRLLIPLVLVVLGARQDDGDHDRILSDTVLFLRFANESESRTVASMMQRWFPERTELAEFAGEEEALGRDGTSFLRKTADRLARLAETKRREGQGATAGMEAFRALNLDPKCGPAAKLLGYSKFRHPREEHLKKHGFTRTRWGWIPSALMKTWKPGMIPDPKGWKPERESDREHGDWERRRTLHYTFVRIETDLPIGEAAFVGVRVDWFLEWLRARFLHVKGYREPKWPINMKIPASKKKFDAETGRFVKKLNLSVLGISLYPGADVVYVDGETCRESNERTHGVAQHEVTHAFLHLAFPDQKERGVRPYAWMDEAFPTLCAYISPDHPMDGNVWEVFEKAFPLSDWKGKMLAQVKGGVNLLAQLNMKTDLNEENTRIKAMLVGAVFSAYCFSDEKLREGFTRFLSDYNREIAKQGSFKVHLGHTQELARKLGEWLTDRSR